MDVTIPTQIIELITVAKLQEFPRSAIAAAQIVEWLWDQVQADSGDYNEQSALADAICQELGITHLDLIELHSGPIQAELNFAMDLALREPLHGLCRALCLVQGPTLSQNLDLNIASLLCIDWTNWEGYNVDDMVELPARYCKFSPLPFEALEIIVSNGANTTLREQLDSFERHLHEHYERNLSDYVVPKLELARA